MRVFDSHAHYFDEKYKTLDGGAEAILNDACFRQSVCGIVNTGTNPDNSRICVESAAAYGFMYAAVGIHPEDSANLGDPAEEVEKIKELAKSAKVVAIGEIGLDYYWQPYDRERQLDFFERQLCLAKELDLPVVIHDREAHGDCFETVLKHPDVRGVFHSFSGSPEMARELTKRGWYISFGGTVTFKNAEKVRRVAGSVPEDRILTETDCPYMAPVPHRGEINRSDYIRLVVEMLAEVRGKTPDQMADICIANAERFFGVKLN